MQIIAILDIDEEKFYHNGSSISECINNLIGYVERPTDDDAKVIITNKQMITKF